MDTLLGHCTGHFIDATLHRGYSTGQTNITGQKSPNSAAFSPYFLLYITHVYVHLSHALELTLVDSGCVVCTPTFYTRLDLRHAQSPRYKTTGLGVISVCVYDLIRPSSRDHPR